MDIENNCAVCWVSQLCPTLCNPMDPNLCPWGFSRQEYWSGLPCLPPGRIFPTQRWNPGLSHCRQILYCLSHQGGHQEVYSGCFLMTGNQVGAPNQNRKRRGLGLVPAVDSEPPGCRALFMLWNVFHEIFWALPVPGTSQGQQCHPGRLPKPGQHCKVVRSNFPPFGVLNGLYPRSPGTHANLLSWDLMTGSWLQRIAWYYKLNVCVLLKFTSWNLIPSMMMFGVWCGAFINKISILTKGSPESCLTPYTM